MMKTNKRDVLYINLTFEEAVEFEKLQHHKWAKASTLATQLFAKQFPEFWEKNQFGIFVPFHAETFHQKYVRKIQFLIDEDTALKVEKLRAMGLNKCMVARMVIMPILQEELQKIPKDN